MTIWSLTWTHGHLEVQSLGAMLGPVEFKLANGSVVQPLAIAPWAEETKASALPGILQRLRGEWPCVPFGGQKLDSLPAHWPPENDSTGSSEMIHGYSSHHHWQLLEHSDVQLSLYMDYPDTSPIKRLTRTITPDAHSPAVDIQLQIEVRESCQLPIGFHPVLRLPDVTHGVELLPGKFRFGHTYPQQFEPSSRIDIDCLFNQLSEVPVMGGKDFDLSLDLLSLPLEDDTEEIVQLCGIDGRFELHNKIENYHVGLQWDPQHFPSCLLWISNRGRSEYPWNNRHLALGIEPIAGVFDLPIYVAQDPKNPIAARGIKTTQTLIPDQHWKTQYRLYVNSAAKTIASLKGK